jgi:hypothetical protein
VEDRQAHMYLSEVVVLCLLPRDAERGLEVVPQPKRMSHLMHHHILDAGHDHVIPDHELHTTRRTKARQTW